MSNNLRILQVSRTDKVGGASRIAWNLYQTYRKRGLKAWMVVGRKTSNDPNVFLIKNDSYRSRWTRTWFNIGNIFSQVIGEIRGIKRIMNIITKVIGQPKRWWNIQEGMEDFNFPGTWHLLDYLLEQPDIVHCHNLHGGYFDLRFLSWLSQRFPVILTLHDAWLLSGHCAHSLDCEKWKRGCGECPNLNIYPAIRKDGTAYNWERKREIYSKSRFHVATPSQWLINKVEQSILAPSIVEDKVIPNGVDLEIFHPYDKQKVRELLRLPKDGKILLYVGSIARKNPWKDYSIIEATCRKVASNLNNSRLILICFDKEPKREYMGSAEIWIFRHHSNPEEIAHFYQAADIYLHAAKVETFPNVIIEALACGTPVVATAVGGIPEQIKSLKYGTESVKYPTYTPKEATGILVPKENAEAMAEAIIKLLTDKRLLYRLSKNASSDACKRFNLNRQVDDYLNWYYKILASHKIANREEQNVK